jgi:UDP-N-acetylglucosamine acyltransferase
MITPNFSFVHPNAKIGKNVSIAPFAVVEEYVEIGDNSIIDSHAIIKNYTKIGVDCHVHAGAVIGGVPQDLKFEGEFSEVIVGNNVTIREFVTINRGTKADGQTTIGDSTLIMAYVHIAHDCHIGSNCILVNNVQIAGHVQIDDWAIIGGSSAVHQFVQVGKHAMISGGSLVRKDVPPFITVAREPLVYMGLNLVGLKRRGFENDRIERINDFYRQIHQLKSLNINNLNQNEDIGEIIQFLNKSTRGIIKFQNIKPENQ